MIAPIIDISSFISGLGFNEDQIHQIATLTVSKATHFITEEIKLKARKDLSKTRKAYVDGIITNYSEDGLSSEIILTGRLANMIEDGMPPYDMKQGFANSPKAKRTETNANKLKKSGKIGYQEKGWYLTIPFRLGTPTAIGENFSGNMEQNVYDIALNELEKTSSLQARNEETNEKYTENKYKGMSLAQLAQLGESYITPSVNRREKWNRSLNVPASYTHKSPMNQGIIRIENVYENATQATYVKFRRVSSKSDPLSWLHPGIKARNYFDKTMSEINFDDMTGTFVKKALTKIGFFD